MKKVLIIDGQGGRIGKTLVERLIACQCRCTLTAVGTNSIATAAMMRAGAQQGATGENPVKVTCADADIIAGPIGILAADSMLGEVTPAMALAVSRSRAQKVLVPVGRCHITVAGAEEPTMANSIEKAVAVICGLCAE